jgi:transcription antitermination factor NusG
VFVKTTDDEIINLSKNVTGIISLLYWKGKPATIKEEEINEIKEFTMNYHNIRLEKMRAYSKSDKKDDVSYVLDGQVFMVKNRVMKVNLPSLGVTMVANVQEEQINERKVSFSNSEMIVQS